MTIHQWQTSSQLASSLAMTRQQVVARAGKTGHSRQIQVKHSKMKGKTALYRVAEKDSNLPTGIFWLEWPGYVEVYDGAIDAVVETFFFHDVEPSEARRLASELPEFTRIPCPARRGEFCRTR